MRTGEKFATRISNAPQMQGVSKTFPMLKNVLISLENANLACLGRDKTIFDAIDDLLYPLNPIKRNRTELQTLSEIQKLIEKATQGACAISTLKPIPTPDGKLTYEKGENPWKNLNGEVVEDIDITAINELITAINTRILELKIEQNQLIEYASPVKRFLENFIFEIASLPSERRQAKQA